MGLDLKEIYGSRADDYERLVVREDYQGNILKALNEIRPMQGLEVVDLGAGTGRLTCMLAPVVDSIHAFDASGHMLEVARKKLQASGLENWQLEVAEHRSLPVPDASVDVALSGWSLVYSAIWAKGDWQIELGETLQEIRRVLRPRGTIIVLETMGTGFEEPHPPADLMDYFNYLDQNGFQSSWIRTDYRFKDLEEARRLTEFFFGDAMLAKIKTTGAVTLPECTGLWWKSA
jgi:ubiquinone/menaquinone biosynthesis C-methylase UbiE